MPVKVSRYQEAILRLRNIRDMIFIAPPPSSATLP